MRSICTDPSPCAPFATTATGRPMFFMSPTLRSRSRSGRSEAARSRGEPESPRRQGACWTFALAARVPRAAARDGLRRRGRDRRDRRWRRAAARGRARVRPDLADGARRLVCRIRRCFGRQSCPDPRRHRFRASRRAAGRRRHGLAVARRPRATRRRAARADHGRSRRRGSFRGADREAPGGTCGRRVQEPVGRRRFLRCTRRPHVPQVLREICTAK